MTTPIASSRHISLGAGWLYYAPIGTPEPVDRTAPLDEAFESIGYTDEGSEISYEMTSEPVEVAEEIDPMFNVTTGRNGNLTFAMAENTVRNLQLAFNGGTVVSVGAEGDFSYEPPEPADQVRRMFVWESSDGEERWLFRQCFQTGGVTKSHRKGSTKSVLPAQFSIEKPPGAKPFKAFYAGARSGGVVAAP